MNSSLAIPLSIALGSALGGVARYFVSIALQDASVGANFPVGTLAINVAGSFLLGLILAMATGGAGMSVEMRALLTTGFCGGFTTFSTFSAETVRLMQDGAWGRASAYVLLSVGLGIAATFAGFAIVERLRAT